MTRAVAASARLSRLTALEAAAAADSKAARGERWPQLEIGAGYQRRSEVPELAIFAPTGNPAEPVQRVVVYPNIQDNWRVRAGARHADLHLRTRGRKGRVGRAGADGRRPRPARRARRPGARDEDRLLGPRDVARQRRAAAGRDPRLRGPHRGRAQPARSSASRRAASCSPSRSSATAPSSTGCARRPGPSSPRRTCAGCSTFRPTARVEPVEPPAEAKAPPPDVEALVLEAQSLRPERQALLARVAAADAAARSEHGGRLPQVELSGGYLYANPNREIVPPTSDWADTWDIGVGISLEGARRRPPRRRTRREPTLRPRPRDRSCASSTVGSGCR